MRRRAVVARGDVEGALERFSASNRNAGGAVPQVRLLVRGTDGAVRKLLARRH
ncbi:MAG: hypothetical protein ABI811_09660 [Acidobacteriota bacterium]